MKADLHTGIFYWVGDGEPLPEVLCLRGLEMPFEVYYDRRRIGICSSWPQPGSLKIDRFGPAPESGPTILPVELDLGLSTPQLPQVERDRDDALLLLQQAWWAMRSCDEPDGDVARTAISERFPLLVPQ